MPELPKKKVGIVACSGEEMAEGTVTRLAALKVLEQLRPSDTVTICLPLSWLAEKGIALLPVSIQPLPLMAVRSVAQPVAPRCIPANLPRRSWSPMWPVSMA